MATRRKPRGDRTCARWRCDRGRGQARGSSSSVGGLGRDVGHGAGCLDLAADRVGVVALVAMQDAARRQPLEELRSSRAIRHLSARQHESYRAAQLVGQAFTLLMLINARAGWKRSQTDCVGSAALRLLPAPVRVETAQ